jgi:hypothetical protein
VVLINQTRGASDRWREETIFPLLGRRARDCSRVDDAFVEER